MSGRAWIFGDDVDTDAIAPGAWMRAGIETLAAHCLEVQDPGFASAVRAGDVVVAGRNFGCGSSREHAPWALEDFGFQAIIAPSFADIFYSNCTKIGLLPAILDEEHCRAVAEAGEARIDVDDETVTCAAGVFEFAVEPDVKHRLLNGLDDIGITLENVAAIDAFEQSGGADRGPATTAL